MKRRFAIIMAALLIAAMAGCSQSGTSSTAEQSTVQSSADSSVAESAESEISEAESSVVSEETSTESSEEKSDTSAAESSENKSKTESSKPKNEESSKKETSKAETSKTETSKPVESSNPVESSKPEESSIPSKKPEESSTPSSTPKQEVKATGITLDLSSLSLTSGSTQELNAYILWSNGTSSYNGITWSTSNNGVATVSSSGYVTAKSAGTATITASYGSFSKSCTVTVKAAQVSQPSSQNSQEKEGDIVAVVISGSGAETEYTGNKTITTEGWMGIYLDKPEQFSISPIFLRGYFMDKPTYERIAALKISEGVTWKSSDTSIATVDNNGEVTGKSKGTCIITASYQGHIATCKIAVMKPREELKSQSVDFTIRDEYYHDEQGNRYSTTWNAAEHEKQKVTTSSGRIVYKCPEIIPIINEYRARENMPPVTWKDDGSCVETLDEQLDTYQYIDLEPYQVIRRGCVYLDSPYNLRAALEAQLYSESSNNHLRLLYYNDPIAFYYDSTGHFFCFD